MAHGDFFCSLFAVCLGLARGMNIVNPTTGKCLDVVVPCPAGSSSKDCQGSAWEKDAKGANLQLFQCDDGENQQFEFLSSGRIRNPVTGLCLDIKAHCEDGSGKKECDRVAVEDIKNQANIQLWHCHEDTGELSRSYGNQKWTFTSTGELKNEGSGLCLEIRGLRDGTHNIQAGACSQSGHQAFEFELGQQAAETEVVEEFQVLPPGFLATPGQSHWATLPLVVGIGGLSVAVFVGASMRRAGTRLSSDAALLE